MEKDLSELELLVMRAFNPMNPLMCVHQIFMATAIPYAKLHLILAKMRRDLYLERVKSPLGEFQYMPTSLLKQAVSMQHASVEWCGLMVGLTEEDMLNRVAMLKRMKRLLIAEWHPTIDVLLCDYERNLARLQALREPVSDSVDFFEKD